jgi:hypothetical protein
MIDAQSSVLGGTGCQPVAAGNLPAALVPQRLLTPSLTGAPGASRSNQIRPKNISAPCHTSLALPHLHSKLNQQASRTTNSNQPFQAQKIPNLVLSKTFKSLANHAKMSPFADLIHISKNER